MRYSPFICLLNGHFCTALRLICAVIKYTFVRSRHSVMRQSADCAMTMIDIWAIVWVFSDGREWKLDWVWCTFRMHTPAHTLCTQRTDMYIRLRGRCLQKSIITLKLNNSHTRLRWKLWNLISSEANANVNVQMIDSLRDLKNIYNNTHNSIVSHSSTTMMQHSAPT